MSFKCVYNSIDNVNVLLAKSMLDNEGIESFIPDDLVANIIPSLTIGGTRLMVNEDDFEDAEKALKEFKEDRI